MPVPASLDPTPAPRPVPEADTAAARLLARLVPGDVDVALRLAEDVGPEVPLPGAGRTAQRWALLADVASRDLTTARVLEAHLDALAILAEAGRPVPRGTWGVFAAEGAGTRLDAHPTPQGWRLSGRKPWCSLASRLDRALVTAHTPDGRRLFAVDLRGPGVRPVAGAWHARGLAAVDSGPVDLDDVPAEPVGEAGWYLRRPGFAHGGLGVAACWYGGARRLARAVAASVAAGASGGRRPPDQLALWHLGRLDLLLAAARSALDAAAGEVDAGRAEGDAGELLALRVRATVAGCAEEVLTTVGHALGPAPLTADAEHAARAADLTVYLRQHHAERDVARLGELLAAAGDPRW